MITDVYSYRFYNITWYKRFVINGIACYLFLDWLHVRYMCLTSRLYLFMIFSMFEAPFSVHANHVRIRSLGPPSIAKWDNMDWTKVQQWCSVWIQFIYYNIYTRMFTYLYSTYYVEYEYIVLRILINYPTLPSRCHKTKHNTLM